MRYACLGIVAVAALAGGCQQPIQPELPTAALVDVPDEQEMDLLWDTCLRVLRRYGLRPDRQDRLAGLITTHPATVPNWFEFWRSDMPANRFGFAEANLATIRRVAKVTLEPPQPGGERKLTVQVELQRLSTPERQATSAAAGLQIFSSKLPTYTGQMAKKEQVERWIPLGRDAQLEETLLEHILAYYGRPWRYPEVPVEEEPAPQTAPTAYAPLSPEP